ncbi:sporulation membrane protein YtaF [Mechercharimyces sp. CAU 1602]|uniref:sporulation membrane protein YtaF n=1 Tax=Mechercharimyces sp. CAU 1602 TaxID=2973933 RepID=UPI0021611E81|nr:sporulation membrane protein YtaF [Mechercharimyces sp. CAU 1602]MCS1351592.1 sporulation membrane protein YtaF [Mechercharimyces sp. CAU 1602]
MWAFISLIFISSAISIDSFGVGLTYGMRGMRLPLTSIFIIAGCSGMVMALSMTVGYWSKDWFSPQATQALGAWILVLLGGWSLLQAWKQSHQKQAFTIQTASIHSERELFSIELRTLGFMIQILRTPMSADRDQSGTISATEAVLLGMALSLDAFGAGIGVAFLGYPSWPVATMIAVMCALFLRVGLEVGFRINKNGKISFFKYIPGLILIVIGLLKSIP